MSGSRPAGLISQAEVTATPDRIELRHMEQVVEIVRSGGFSAAARRLNQTQPALSKSIARLEAQLGVRLFERTGGGAQPTEFGRLMAEKSRSLLEAAAELGRDVALLAGGGPGRLRIGVGPATRLKPLPQVVEGLLARFPGIQLETRQEPAPSLPCGVEEGRFDLVFVHSEGAEPHGDLMRVKIFQDRQVVVLRPGHPLAGRRGEIATRELMEHPWASWGVTPSFRRWTGDLTPAQSRTTTAFTSDDFQVIAETAATSDYVARGPYFLFRDALAAGALVEVKTSYRAGYECWMLTTPARWRSPVVKATADIAKAAAKAFFAEP